MLEISNFFKVEMTNMAHCVIKSGNLENINLLIYVVCLAQKVTQIVPKSVFWAQKTVFLAQNEDQTSKSPIKHGIV